MLTKSAASLCVLKSKVVSGIVTYSRPYWSVSAHGTLLEEEHIKASYTDGQQLQDRTCLATYRHCDLQ
jgi:hypothetical protein